MCKKSICLQRYPFTGSLQRWLKCVRPAKDWGACGSEVDAESDIPDYIRSEKEEYIKRLSMAHNLGIDNPALSLEDTLAALDPQVRSRSELSTHVNDYLIDPDHVA